MLRNRFSRREILEKCVAMGVLSAALPLKGSALAALYEEREQRHATPDNALGPFYKRKAPERTNLRVPGDPGMPLAISGQIVDTRGEIIQGASIEIWHSDHLGHYDVDGYRYRALMHTIGKGEYAFTSLMPGHYPDRVAQHVHYLVQAPGHKPLATQLYFATDPVFKGDPDKNFHVDPLCTSRELVRPVLLTGDPKDIEAKVTFDICLEKL
jgi:protocatechuate 3,4-dioxygenase beta subunit